MSQWQSWLHFCHMNWFRRLVSLEPPSEADFIPRGKERHFLPFILWCFMSLEESYYRLGLERMGVPFSSYCSPSILRVDDVLRYSDEGCKSGSDLYFS